MARSVRATIETRSARLRLRGRKEPYWQTLQRGLAAGYHRPMNGGAGTWWGRALVGERYKIGALATADDHNDADGETVLNWAQAQAAIRTWAAKQTGAGPYTIADACRDYVADLRARRGAAAAREAEGRLQKHLLPKLGERRLADLTEGDLRDWRNSLVASDTMDEETVRRSRDTANRVRSIVWAAFNLAFSSGEVADDRTWRRVGPFEDVGAARKVFLDNAEQQRLVDACEPDLQKLMFGLAETGARLGELTGALVRNLDLDQATLTVTSHKGRRGRTRQRDIHLAKRSLPFWRGLASGKGTDDHLFTTTAATPWIKSLHTRRVRAAVKKAGLDPATTAYSLRHSYISGALKAGVPTKAVALHVGSSVLMIEKHYGKFVKADLASYAQKAGPKLKIDADSNIVQMPRRAAR